MGRKGQVCSRRGQRTCRSAALSLPLQLKAARQHVALGSLVVDLPALHANEHQQDMHPRQKVSWQQTAKASMVYLPGTGMALVLTCCARAAALWSDFPVVTQVKQCYSRAYGKISSLTFKLKTSTRTPPWYFGKFNGSIPIRNAVTQAV